MILTGAGLLGAGLVVVNPDLTALGLVTAMVLPLPVWLISARTRRGGTLRTAG
jgi:hypothetical protein